ncbi:hypothetical protein Hanom_Chr00s000083g01619201 [Helianthus anomalus]
MFRQVLLSQFITYRRFLLCVETREEPVFEFATPSTSPKAADVEVKKEDRRSPSIEVVTPPSVHPEDTAKKPVAETIDDTLDSSNNLIYPHEVENRGVENRSPLWLRNLSPPFLRRLPVQLPRGLGLKINPLFSMERLNWSSITAVGSYTDPKESIRRVLHQYKWRKQMY